MTECVSCAKFKGCDLSSPNVNECADYKEILTNEEWFTSLSTEEKAEWITENITVYADDWVKSDEKLLNPATWVDWLKEKHHSE